MTRPLIPSRRRTPRVGQRALVGRVRRTGCAVALRSSPPGGLLGVKTPHPETQYPIRNADSWIADSSSLGFHLPVLRFLLGLLGLFLVTNALPAAPPAATGLRPPGVQRGTTARVELTGSLGTRPVRAWCDRPDVTVVVDPDKEALEITAAAEARPGLAWVRLYNAEGAGDLLPLHVGLVPELAEVEPNNRLREATPVESLPVTIPGVLHRSGEVDVFRVVLSSGQTLAALLDAHETLGSPMDGVLQIVSDQGFVVAQNDDHHGLDPLVAWRAEEGGVVYVRLFAFPAEPSSTINFAGGNEYAYRLTLTPGPLIEQVLPPDAPGEAPRCLGWNLPETGLDPANTPGLHWIADRTRTSDHEGGEEVSEQAAAGELERDRAVVGRIAERGESDVYRFTAKQEESLRLQVEARCFWSPLDPVLTLLDASGNRLREVDDLARENLDVDLVWKAPADGEYRAVVTDRYGHGGGSYVYRLSLSPERPRVTLKVSSDRFVLKPGETREVAVTVDRQGGFAEELTITAADLPDGVEGTPVVSQASGGTAKQVTLKLQAKEGAVFHGPIRIVGRRGDEHAPEFAARAETRLPGRTTTQLWLTVPGPLSP